MIKSYGIQHSEVGEKKRKSGPRKKETVREVENRRRAASWKPQIEENSSRSRQIEIGNQALETTMWR